MGRLTQMQPRVAGAAARVASHGAGPDRLARRDATVGWRKWYKLADWRRLRWQVLVEASFTCARCGWFGGSETAKLVADHVQPHRGERALFFDRANVQCLCKPCHDGPKAKLEWQQGFR